MLIKFLDKRYEVIQNIRRDGAVKVYAAKDLNAPGGDICTVACVSDSELIKKLIPVTTRKRTSLAFKDLRCCFNADGKYWIVFDHAKGTTLGMALQENDYTLKERLALMKNIFAQMFLLDMPDCFIYEVLKKDSIVVNGALEVRFNYFFTELDYYWQVEEKHCLRRIGELVQELFRKELTDKSSAKLFDFARKLKQEEYLYIWDCYEAFDELYGGLYEQSENHEIRPGRVWWRAWEGLKKKLPVIRSALAAALIVASGLYLLLHLPNPVLSEDGISFQQIGTLEIQEYH